MFIWLVGPRKSVLDGVQDRTYSVASARNDKLTIRPFAKSLWTRVIYLRVNRHPSSASTWCDWRCSRYSAMCWRCTTSHTVLHSTLSSLTSRSTTWLVFTASFACRRDTACVSVSAAAARRHWSAWPPTRPSAASSRSCSHAATTRRHSAKISRSFVMSSPSDSVGERVVFSGCFFGAFVLSFVRSFVLPVRSCYHDISRTAWASSVKLTGNIL